jgi:hypothetical protein
MALYRRSKNTNKPLLKQILEFIPNHIFRGSVQKHQSDKGTHKYKTWDQFVALIFGQLNKMMKQNLQIKTFIGTSENAVKSQIYVAMICYLLLELIKRLYCKAGAAFSNLCEKVRICLVHYLTLEYVCNDLRPIAKKVVKTNQLSIDLKDNSPTQLVLRL